MGKTEIEQPPSQGFTGTVSLQLSDLLQMFCLSRGDLLVRVTSVEGTGTIYVHAGQIQDAHTEGMEGEAAFFDIFSWRDGHFDMLPYYDSGHHSIDKPWEHMLLEAMRQRDESLATGLADGVPIGEAEDAGDDLGECAALEEVLDLVFDRLEFDAQDIQDVQPGELTPESQVPATTKGHSFTTNMFLDSLAQYDQDRHRFNATLRFNLIHHPLSDLFLVYNEQQITNNPDIRPGRSLILKVTRMMSF